MLMKAAKVHLNESLEFSDRLIIMNNLPKQSEFQLILICLKYR